MTRISAFSMALAALLAVPAVAPAAPPPLMPVSYTVEEKPLKAAASGTPLTFELFSDATCTTLEYVQAIGIQDVTLINKLKQLTPKNDTKLPNTVELQTTLSVVAIPSPAYLKVSGVGVAAVGGDCQAQVSGAAGPAGPPGGPGPQGPSGVVSIAQLYQFPTATIPGGGSAYAFIGSPTAVTVGVGQRITAVGQIALGSTSTSTSFQLSICLEDTAAPGTLTLLHDYSVVSLTAGSRPALPASASGTSAVGIINVGLCVLNFGPNTITSIDLGWGWVMVTN